MRYLPCLFFLIALIPFSHAQSNPESAAVSVFLDSIVHEKCKGAHHVSVKVPKETDTFGSALYHLDTECLDRERFPDLFRRFGDNTKEAVSLHLPSKKRIYKISSPSANKLKVKRMKMAVYRATAVTEDMQLVTIELWNKTGGYVFFVFLDTQHQLIRWCQGSYLT